MYGLGAEEVTQVSTILVGSREELRVLENFLKDGGFVEPHP